MKTEEFYKPSEIRYSKLQFLWLVREVCGSMAWPSDGKESGYNGGKGKSPGHHASYETVKTITSECEVRLQRCREDGLMLEFIILFGDFDDYTYQKLANYMRVDIDKIRWRIKMALKYCCGHRRKRISYRHYLYNARLHDANRESRGASPALR